MNINVIKCNDHDQNVLSVRQRKRLDEHSQPEVLIFCVACSDLLIVMLMMTFCFCVEKLTGLWVREWRGQASHFFGGTGWERGSLVSKLVHSYVCCCFFFVLFFSQFCTLPWAVSSTKTRTA